MLVIIAGIVIFCMIFVFIDDYGFINGLLMTIAVGALVCALLLGLMLAAMVIWLIITKNAGHHINPDDLLSVFKWFCILAAIGLASGILFAFKYR